MSILIARLGRVDQGEKVTGWFATCTALIVGGTFDSPLVDVGIATGPLSVAVETFCESQYDEADSTRQKMRWRLRTKVVDDAFIVVIGGLPLLNEALYLDDFRR